MSIQMLTDACENAMDLITKEYYSDDDPLEEIDFSDAFEDKMQRLLRIHKKLYYQMINTVGKRVAILLVTLSTLLFATKVEAIYHIIFNYIVTDRVEDSYIVIDAQEDQTIPTIIEEERIPIYIPKGYVEIDRVIVTEAFVKVSYTNFKKEYNFKQMLLNTGSTINTEGIEAESLEINGIKVLFCNNINDILATWSDGSYSYIINGDISKDEIIKIIGSQ